MHTPGPWEADHPSHRIDYSHWIVGNDGKRGLLAQVIQKPENPEVSDANARLIAAAPDLLVACEAMIHAAKLGDPDAGALATTLAEAAVAKAVPG